jgi:hypothetical protein
MASGVRSIDNGEMVVELCPETQVTSGGNVAQYMKMRGEAVRRG